MKMFYSRVRVVWLEQWFEFCLLFPSAYLFSFHFWPEKGLSFILRYSYLFSFCVHVCFSCCPGGSCAMSACTSKSWRPVLCSSSTWPTAAWTKVCEQQCWRPCAHTFMCFRSGFVFHVVCQVPLPQDLTACYCCKQKRTYLRLDTYFLLLPLYCCAMQYCHALGLEFICVNGSFAGVVGACCCRYRWGNKMKSRFDLLSVVGWDILVGQIDLATHWSHVFTLVCSMLTLFSYSTTLLNLGSLSLWCWTVATMRWGNEFWGYCLFSLE